MKRVLTYLFAAGMMISAASLMFTSCTKEGPQGPAGADGKDGTDANATCTQCHNFSELIVAKIFQYEASQHATGSTTFENRTTCAPCHTSQGFQETYPTGASATAEAIQNAVRINCRTCHNIHDTYTAEDWTLRTTSAFTNRLGLEQDMTTEGGNATGNLCARCHQSRAVTPAITDPTDDVTTLIPTSKRYGPHYGPQSLMLEGMGGFEIIAGATLPNSYHTGRATCLDCHGAAAVGNMTGGHTYWLDNEEEGENLSGCNTEACHNGNVDALDYEGKQTIIADKEAQLLALMQAEGIMDADGYVIPNVPYTQKVLAIVYNWKMVHGDRSEGIHNFKYAQAMLDDGIAYFTGK